MILEINSILFPSPRPKPFNSPTYSNNYNKDEELFKTYLNERKADCSWFYVIQQRRAQGADKLMWQNEDEDVRIFRCFHNVRHSNLEEYPEKFTKIKIFL